MVVTVKDRIAVKVEIVWSDGTRSLAEGDHAQEVIQWYHACEIMSANHGIEYRGRRMQLLDKDGNEVPE